MAKWIVISIFLKGSLKYFQCSHRIMYCWKCPLFWRPRESLHLSEVCQGHWRFEKNQVFWEELGGRKSRRHSQSWELGARKAWFYSAPWTGLLELSGPWTEKLVTPAEGTTLVWERTKRNQTDKLLFPSLQPELSHLLLNLKNRGTGSEYILKALVTRGDKRWGGLYKQKWFWLMYLEELWKN